MIDAIKTTLGELADVRTGHQFRGAIPDVPDGPVAVVQMRDLLTTGIANWDGVQRTQLETRKEPDWLRPGDLLFAARGPSNYAGVLGTVPLPAVCSPHLQLLRVRDQRVLPAFLAWQINQEPAQKYFWQAAEGSAQLSVRRSLLEALPIVIPPLEKQHLIVAAAAAADQERELLIRLIQNRAQQMEALAASLLTTPTT